MQTTYRLKAQQISMTLLNSLKTMFAGKEVEITIRSIEPNNKTLSKEAKHSLLQMVQGNRLSAPVISPDIDIRDLIDQAHNRFDV
jgi:hypothetical protein